MAVGLSAAEANTIVDGLSGTYVRLHVGDPGAAGTANGATETTRKLLTLGTASAGAATNTAALTWTSISGSQTATHYSLWTASSGGTFRFSGTVSADGYTAGGTFTIAVGQFSVTVPTLAA